MNFEKKKNDKMGKIGLTTLKINNLRIDPKKLENSALNALKHSSQKINPILSKLLNNRDFDDKNNFKNDLNSEEYEIRKKALENLNKLRQVKEKKEIDSKIFKEKSNEITSQITQLESTKDQSKNINEKKSIINLENSKNIKSTKDKNFTKEDIDESMFIESKKKTINLYKKNEQKQTFNKNEKKQNEQELDDYLNSLVSENNKRNNNINYNQNRQNNFRNHNEQYSARKQNTSKITDNHEKASQKQNTKRSEADLKDKDKFNHFDEKSRSKNIKFDKKKNPDYKASLLNIIDNNNEDIIYNKEIFKSNLQKKKNKSAQDVVDLQKFSPKEVVVGSENNLRELANSINLKASDLIKVLNKIDKKTKYKESSMLDQEIAEIALLELGHIPITESFMTIDKIISNLCASNEELLHRPPIVTIMGHVDHGKTSLLDSMRKKFMKSTSNIVDGEDGGITQHIGAYQIISDSGKIISFIDTPGHEAFTAIRARGSLITDIVILVVAADDGIMPQTIEAIRHAQSAKVPIIVAINKIDMPGANIQNILNQLIQYDIITEENGGDVIAVPISAKFSTNLDKLEDAILLEAEMLDLKARHNGLAFGTIIEARINQSRGPCATVLVQSGILKISDTLITSNLFCKVRSMTDENLVDLKEAGPSKAVEVYGFSELPLVGEKFVVLENEKIAKSTLENIKSDIEKQKIIQEKKKEVEKSLSFDKNNNSTSRSRSIFDLFSSNMKSNSDNSEAPKEINFIIKADVSGTLDAIKYSLEKLNNENTKVIIKIIYSSTGAVTESDIMLAKSSSSIICAFGVGAQANIRNLIEKENLTFKTYTIIYQLIDDIKLIIDNKIKPQTVEKNIGKALVKQIFNIKGVGIIAGCEVKDGNIIAKNSFIRIKRDSKIIAEDVLIKELR